jgi:hypothetical protein
MRFISRTLTIAGLLILSGLGASAGEEGFVAFPENGTTVTVLQGGAPFMDVFFMGWGPKWAWMGFQGDIREQGEESLLSGAAKTASGAELRLGVRARKAAARRLALDIDLSTSKDTDLTYIIAGLDLDEKRFAKGKVVATMADGTEKEVALPFGKKGLGEAVRKMVLVDGGGQSTVLSLDPPCAVPSDGAARIVLASGPFKAAAPSKVALTVDFPADLTWHAAPGKIGFEKGFENWFEFKPDTDYEKPSEIGMQDWLEAPAGKHGRLQRKDDRLLYNGKPIKLWGINLCYGTCAPEKALADKRAKFYSTYGINAVRLHKWADGSGWAGIQSKDSFVEFDPAGLDLMDYQVAQFKKHGIYVKLSAHFGAQQLGPADRKHVPYLDEFGDGKKKDRVATPHSAVHYAPELQDVQALQMVNLLKHKNPYTGLTYAEDPAIAFVEIINEQCIFFYTSMAPLKASPTIRKNVGKRFCDWLRKKYGTAEKFLEAWGDKALDSFQNDIKSEGERLEKDNILPLGNPWYWDPVQLQGSQAFRKRRLLDSLKFLYDIQNEFYDRYVKAVRDAGYAGEVLSSNWQAGRAYSHYYNLHSDARVGVVDRHNYFGGEKGQRIDNASMLAVPGSGILSSGMQQVADRPFMLSEWIHVTPTEWGVEGPAIIGAYGMGLQGWDVSFMFQNRDSGGFSEKVGRDRWDVTAPNVLGVFPAVARQVLRGDVAESELRAPRFVHVPSLDAEKLGFEDKVDQEYDVKSFGGDKVPTRALAAARCVVEFTDAYQDTPAFDLSKYVRDGWVASSTGQLRWKEGSSKLSGFFTLNTAATKAVVGFAEGQACELGNVTIKLGSRYGAVYVTARERDRDAGSSKGLLVVAVARARNTGMKVLNDERILDPGKGPVVMEPVRAEISIRRKGNPSVILLDHNGRKTDRTLPVKDGAFEIDGARDKTCYYLVSYPE